MEQEAQIAAPRKPYQGLIQSISNIFHPLLVLTYTALVICIFTAMKALPFQVKAWFVGMVFLYTLILTSIYEIVAVLLETMTFKNFGHTLLVILGNTVFSVFVILCVEYIFHPREKKNEA